MSISSPQDKKQTSSDIKVSVVSPHNKAVYEAGKKLLIDSIDIGRDFCKSMITISTGSIPIYIAMLKLAGVESFGNSSFTFLIRFIYISPCIFFLTASIIFVVGYFPNTGKFSLDIIQEIESARRNMIKRRMRFIIIGVATFSIAVFIAFVSLVIILTS
jgi:hypothetical protein